MKKRDTVSRRSFLAISAAAPFCVSLAIPQKDIPVGLELYSVRDDLKKDLPNSTRRIINGH
jgi:hypothetical protein